MLPVSRLLLIFRGKTVFSVESLLGKESKAKKRVAENARGISASRAVTAIDVAPLRPH